MSTLTATAPAPPAAALVPACPGFSRATLAFARRELRDAVTSRWFPLYTIGFAVLAMATSFMALAGSGSMGFAGFGRTAAGLLNLVMLIVPLMAMTAGATSIAGERERGTLLYLLAQPVSPREILLGKFLGLSIALCASVCIGFSLSAAVLAWKAGGTGVGSFLMLVAMTCLLTVVMLSVGLLISVCTRKASVATGVAVFTWLAFVFLSDLGLMAGTIVFKLRVQELFTLAMLNPIQAYKMSVVNGLNASLDVLGPAGAYASRHYGSALPWMLLGVLTAWGALSLTLASVIFTRKSPA